MNLGATETVMGEDQAPGIPTVPSISSIRGVQYEVANGTRIKNRGDNIMVLKTAEGQERTIVCQICDVNKCLLSTAKLNEAGQRVMRDGEKSYIEDVASGDTIPVQFNNRIYSIKVWVRAAPGGSGQLQTVLRKEDTVSEGDASTSGFARQGK